MNKKIITTIIALMGLCATLFAQEQTMQVMKGGAVVFETPASESEKMIFQNPSGPATPFSDDALIVQVAGATIDTIRLDNIKEISFSGGNMSVVSQSGITKTYTMSYIKITFGKGNFTGINYPETDIILKAYFNTASNVVVESDAGILSLALISIDGQIVAAEKYNGTDLRARLFAPLPAGIYILCVETTQGITVRKLIRN